MLMRIACHYLACRADAEDAVQEAFLRWLKGGRGPHGLRGEEAVKAWLIRVTINICKDQCKSARRRCVPLEEGQQAAREIVSPVLGEVMALPEQYRAVVYLYYYEGYTLREIARLLGKNEHTVQSWHRRAKAILRDALGGIDNELETKI